MSEDRGTVRADLRLIAPDLLGYFERRAATRDDAADLVGETLLQAWRRIDSAPLDTERRRMWLFTVAAHVLANHRRSSRRRTALTRRLRHHLSESSCEGPEDVYGVRDAVLRLDEAHRELVMLVHWDGFSLVEAAELLDLNPSTARSRYAVARQTLRAALEEGACLLGR